MVGRLSSPWIAPHPLVGLSGRSWGQQSEGNEVSELSGVNWAGKDKPAAEELVLLLYSYGNCHHEARQEREWASAYHSWSFKIKYTVFSLLFFFWNITWYMALTGGNGDPSFQCKSVSLEIKFELGYYVYDFLFFTFKPCLWLQWVWIYENTLAIT